MEVIMNKKCKRFLLNNYSVCLTLWGLQSCCLA